MKSGASFFAFSLQLGPVCLPDPSCLSVSFTKTFQEKHSLGSQPSPLIRESTKPSAQGVSRSRMPTWCDGEVKPTCNLRHDVVHALSASGCQAMLRRTCHPCAVQCLCSVYASHKGSTWRLCRLGCHDQKRLHSAIQPMYTHAPNLSVSLRNIEGECTFIRSSTTVWLLWRAVLHWNAMTFFRLTTASTPAFACVVHVCAQEHCTMKPRSEATSSESW